MSHYIPHCAIVTNLLIVVCDMLFIVWIFLRYYRIEKVLKPRTHSNDIESIFNPQTRFHHYMARLIGDNREPTSQAQLTWVNALLGRLFWDVWKSEYWNNKVKNRLQNKISRMKLPPFIRYLKVG